MRTGIFDSEGANIVSVFVSPDSEEGRATKERVAVFRIDTIDPRRVVKSHRWAGYSVLWQPAEEPERSEARRL